MFKGFVELANGTEIISTCTGTSEEMAKVGANMAASCMRNGLDVLSFGSKRVF